MKSNCCFDQTTYVINPSSSTCNYLTKGDTSGPPLMNPLSQAPYFVNIPNQGDCVKSTLPKEIYGDFYLKVTNANNVKIYSDSDPGCKNPISTIRPKPKERGLYSTGTGQVSNITTSKVEVFDTSSDSNNKCTSIENLMYTDGNDGDGKAPLSVHRRWQCLPS